MSISTRGALVLLCGLALVAGGCKDRPGSAKGDAPATDTVRPVSGGTAVVAELTDMEKAMPLVWQSNLDSDLVDIMYMGLTRMVWRDGRAAYLLADESPMALAWKWEYANADSSAVRYYMRANLKWSDGYPITAQDVAWTYAMMRNPALASSRQDDANLIESVEAENDTMVLFHFKRRSPSMLYQAGLPVAPRHAYDDVGPSGIRTHSVFSNPTRMVVSGPFRIGAWRPNERITLVPNPSFKPRARLDAIVIRVIPEPTTRLTELETGGVDFVRHVTIDLMRGLRQRKPEVRVLREEKRFWEFIAYNPREVEAFRDPEVRRALGMAIDVPRIIRELQLEDFVQPAYGPYPPIFADLFDARRDLPLRHDPAGARRILESRGWRDTNGDGILDRDGKPFRFTLLTNAGNQRRADVTQQVQAQWRAIGVDAQLAKQDQNTVIERETERKDYEAVLNGWGVALDPDISNFFTPGGGFNIVSYENPEVTALIERAKQERTYPASTSLWRAAAERVVRDQPYTWLYYYDDLSAANDRLRGMKVDTYGAFQNTWEWWIPVDRQRRGGR
jgi:peptide/nickel transport system substrate-binding protein